MIKERSLRFEWCSGWAEPTEVQSQDDIIHEASRLCEFRFGNREGRMLELKEID